MEYIRAIYKIILFYLIAPKFGSAMRRDAMRCNSVQSGSKRRKVLVSSILLDISGEVFTVTGDETKESVSNSNAKRLY